MMMMMMVCGDYGSVLPEEGDAVYSRSSEGTAVAFIGEGAVSTELSSSAAPVGSEHV